MVLANAAGRAEDTFRYDSPSWNGLKVGATYTMQTDFGQSTDTPFSVGAEYKNGPFLVFADYITNDNGGDDDAYKVGGKYTFGNYSLYGQYEVDGGLISNLSGNQGIKVGGTKANNGDGADVWELGGTAQFGNNTLVAAYGQGDKTTGNGLSSFDNGYETFEIVGIHSMSKRTLVYLAYVNRSFDGKEVVTNSGGSYLRNISDLDQVSLGMKHKF